MARRDTAFLIVMVALLLASASEGAPGQTPSAPAELVQQFQSPDPIKRAQAFDALSGIPGALAALGASGVLLRALDREDRLVYSTLDESNGHVGISDKYGEGFGEYTSMLWGACTRYCDKHDPMLVQVFVNGPLAGSNPFMQQLAADHGPEMLPMILRLARPGKYDHQIGAVEMLGTIARFSKVLSAEERRLLDSSLVAAVRSQSPVVPEFAVQALSDVARDDASLSAAQRSVYHQAIASATTNKYSGVRQAAIRALASGGDKADLPLLRQLAENDTARSVNHETVTYPVREEAKRAIAKIGPPRQQQE